MALYLLNKSLNGLYYLDGTEHNGYDLSLLSKHYPEDHFVVLNEGIGQYSAPNIYSKAQIIQACSLDDKLQYRCPACSKKNAYIRSSCRKCEEGFPHHEMLINMLGTNYMKAAMQHRVDMFLNTAGQKSRGTNTFVSFNTASNDIGENDHLLQRIAKGHKIVFYR